MFDLENLLYSHKFQVCQERKLCFIKQLRFLALLEFWSLLTDTKGLTGNTFLSHFNLKRFLFPPHL